MQHTSAGVTEAPVVWCALTTQSHWACCREREFIFSEFTCRCISWWDKMQPACEFMYNTRWATVLWRALHTAGVWNHSGHNVTQHWHYHLIKLINRCFLTNGADISVWCRWMQVGFGASFSSSLTPAIGNNPNDKSQMEPNGEDEACRSRTTSWKKTSPQSGGEPQSQVIIHCGYITINWHLLHYAVILSIVNIEIVLQFEVFFHCGI